MRKIGCGVVLSVLVMAGLVRGADLEARFQSPPDEARPWVYWFWMNGNVTEEGITADLEAMHDVGIGGALIMGVGLRTPHGPADFNSPLWRDLYAHAADEAQRLGMHLTLHQCDGWATAGGKWIDPERSIKMFVSTTKEVTGPVDAPIQLEHPEVRENFYEEVATLAVPVSAESVANPVRATAHGEPAPALIDGDPMTGVPVGRYELVLDAPQRIRSVVMRMPKARFHLGPDVRTTVEVSVDGQRFGPVAEFVINASHHHGPRTTLTVSFPERRARFVRIRPERTMPNEIGEIEVSAEPRVHLWEVKAGFAREREHGGETAWIDAAPFPSYELPAGRVADTDEVLDLTDRLEEDGTLNWTVPEGRWRIVRFGMTSTGKHVAPGTHAGRGLEADKMSGEAIRHHFNAFAREMIEEHNTAPGEPIYSVHTDSWESGLHTWSSHFREEFETRRGYEMTPWLPVLATGTVIGSPEESERFLWDVRRTMADLIRDNFYGQMRELCHASGVQFQSEAAGRQMFMYDPLEYASKTDIYVGEFWTMDAVRVDCRIAGSAAHTYNRPLAAAESFTSGHGGFAYDMFDVKPLGDRAFCEGINRYIIHRYCMQPFNNVEPGMTFGPYGINFERTQTWWNNGAKAWCDYVRRCQAMLQSGRFVADVIHYIGHDAPNFLGHREDLWSPVPAGYDFDGCNLEILRQLTVAEDGNLVLPHGMRYRVLLLPNRAHMTLEAVREVERLVRAGAVAVGPKPVRTPGLQDYRRRDAALREIADRVWGGVEGETVQEHRYGRGRVIFGPSLEEVLNAMAPPDFDYTVKDADTTVHYIHRREGDADFYFVANANRGAAIDAALRFRVSGRAPELWDPATGTITRPAVYREAGGVTELPVHLDPAGSVFVVFRRPAQADRLVAVTRDGASCFPFEERHETETPLATDANNADVTDTFTMAGWVEPESTIPLPDESARSMVLSGMNYVVYAAPGHEVYGEDHLGAGISVGSNGAVVLAHGHRMIAPLLAYEGDLRGWHHLAVVFREGVPELYVDGARVATGRVSPRTVHPSTGVEHPRRVPVFAGKVAGLRQRAASLTAEAIRTLAEDTAPPEAAFGGIPLQLVRSDDGVIATGGRPGAYTARTSRGETHTWTVDPVDSSKIEGPWSLSFPPDKGAPSSAQFAELHSWTESDEPGVKYFSGTATYKKTFQADPRLAGSDRVWLDLGRVKNVAEVRLNGIDLGVLWKPPFRMEVTDALRRGSNELEVRVTNLWPNRLIGDEKMHPDPSLDYHPRGPNWSAAGPLQHIPDWVREGGESPVGRTTFVLWKFYDGEAPLLESGLMGPVELLPVQERRLGAP
ncbi:glycosyl hydrolase [Kiritimatiella glycovorans]|uniref:Beta-mannosidase-like galactose-binding domain-containing protein n=1 Tax=Kiritimatiella glycovorans TaxID=1307763 RepID=A0A0G3EHE9_9BACT|nr:glycosyl hydrolase [Kiritimatiella glycovorans]AKJ63599.1 hypothetical protein L21SP4_00318 [Kiritimatiella glycovorans]